MRFGAAFWVNRTTWPDLLAACKAVEAAGWDSLWIDDHLLADEGDPRDAKLEGWTTLAALSVLTERVRLGLLVGANTFRNPGLTAKLATTLDQLSNGRVVLGLGGGWFEREHDAFGLDFGSGFGERLDRLDEACGLIRRLLDGQTVTHDGRFYTMRDAVCEPRPVQPRLPILIGGSGPDEDAPDDRPLRRPVERLRHARADRGDQRDPRPTLRRGRPPVRGHRADRHDPCGHPRHARPRPMPPGRRRPGSTGWKGGSDPTAASAASRSAGHRRRWPRTSTATAGTGSVRSSSCSASPFDLETIERVGELRTA